ncbi:hypothetical protein [Microbacterium sp. 16-032]|uniref:hypothetical protein n=1 Tax=Microbacterium sp. 16-032 TaxID=3239808 RepID=UPI0034E20E33
MATIQHRPSGVAVCGVCSHSEIDAITAEIEAKVPVAQLAEKYGLSRDSLYRHTRRAHHDLRVVTVAAVRADDELRVLDLTDRLHRIATGAQAASDAAYVVGDLALGSKLGDSATRALGLLANTLGVTSGDAQRAYKQAMTKVRRADGIAQTMYRAATTHPEIALLLAQHARDIGLDDVADRLAAITQEDSDDPEGTS